MVKTVRYLGALAAASVALTACASTPATSATSTGTSTSASASASASAAPTERSSRFYISQSDLAKVKADNLYDAIYKLRPEFLRGRSDNSSFVQEASTAGSRDPVGSPAPSSASTGSAILGGTVPVQAYKDNVRLSSVDDLKQILVPSVRDVRFLAGPEAAVKLGTNNSGGAIIVTSR